MNPVMSSFLALAFLCILFASAVVACGVFMRVAIEIERLGARRLLAAALRTPRSVERAWVSPPDEDGLRCLVVKPVGAARARTVALDFEVDETVRRFSLAGIRVGNSEHLVAT